MNYNSGFESGVGIGRMEGRDGTPCMSNNVVQYWEGKLPWKSLPRAFKAGVYAGYREGWAEAYRDQVELEREEFERLPKPPPVAFEYRRDNKPMPQGETVDVRCPARPAHIASAEYQEWLLAQGIVTPQNFHLPRPAYVEPPRKPRETPPVARPVKVIDFDALERDISADRS